MNRHLSATHPYPFERMAALLDGVTANTNSPLVAWSVGEPKHAAPDFLVRALADEMMLLQDFGDRQAAE